MKSKKLTDLCNPKQWKTIAAKELLEEGYPVYGANGIVGYWREYNHETETLAIACRGTCGTVNVIPPKSYINGNAMCLDNISDDVDLKYLFYYLKAYDFNKVISGTAVPQITIESLKKIDVLIPSKKEQKRIVYIFDILSQIIESKEKENKRYDDLIKARFIEMFGDPIDNPREYPVHQLSEYIMSLTSGSRGWAQYCVDDGEEWFITIKNVNNCHISIDNMQPVNAPDNAEAKRTKVHEGDLLISITADLGRTGVVTKEIAEYGAYINQHLSCIRLNRDVLNPLFVAHYMESPAGKEQFIAKNQSAVKAGLNFNSINSLKIMVPPLAEQNRFIDFIKLVDKSREAVKKSLEKTQQLYNSLMQEYFG